MATLNDIRDGDVILVTKKFQIFALTVSTNKHSVVQLPSQLIACVVRNRRNVRASSAGLSRPCSLFVALAT
jgi:hypothetical protein